VFVGEPVEGESVIVGEPVEGGLWMIPCEGETGVGVGVGGGGVGSSFEAMGT
jgi:hypothetical protein